MWQVSHPERNGTAWLMGSIHYGSAEFYPLPETITAAYDASDVLVVELNPDALNPEQVSKALREQGSWPVTDTNVNVLRNKPANLFGNLCVNAESKTVSMRSDLRILAPGWWYCNWLTCNWIAAALPGRTA